MFRVIAPLVALLAVLGLAVSACGGGSAGNRTQPPAPVRNVPSEGGIQQQVKTASAPVASDFPPSKGKTLQQLADGMVAGPSLAMASSVFTTPGATRMAFGMIGQDGQPIYGPTAIYVAPTPNDPAVGPFVAPADVLLTDKRYRSKQAATASDPFVAVYGANVKFPKRGKFAVLAATKKSNGQTAGATGQVDVSSKSADPIPEVGQQAPKIHTDTLDSAKGDVSKIDTRDPPDDMHDADFASLVGKKPVVLLFATPQLCQSRVCGPVTDIELQMKSRYGEKATFIHQEVYVDNDVNKGLRPPLRQYNLPSEPWLFVVNKQGKITARLEGSIGVRQFEDTVKSGL